MEENKVKEGKKITLATLIVIIINIIAIGFMLVVIGASFIQEKCDKSSNIRCFSISINFY